MQKIYVPTPKKKVIDNDAVEIDESKMRTYTATRIKKDGTSTTYAKTYILKGGRSPILRDGDIAYRTTQYKKQDGTITTYRTEYTPKVRNHKYHVVLEKEIQSNIQKLRRSKDVSSFEAIIEFMKTLPSLQVN